MRTILLKWWRWEARRKVKAGLSDDCCLYIDRADAEDRGYRWLRWREADGDFVATNQYTCFENSDDMLVALRRARWAYIWEKVCVMRRKRFREHLSRY